ncbi:MAG: hypothetical protein CL677_01590 [Bdellovibrionaceae bacterium]|nr:hypothetical protein [Pseudobdellovibrionaceae bacterium]|tara:strand:+ start:44075 stop:44545 length:471 start_codon:yes stop_codon:yes gene_type:complete
MRGAFLIVSLLTLSLGVGADPVLNGFDSAEEPEVVTLTPIVERVVESPQEGQVYLYGIGLEASSDFYGATFIPFGVVPDSQYIYQQLNFICQAYGYGVVPEVRFTPELLNLDDRFAIIGSGDPLRVRVRIYSEDYPARDFRRVKNLVCLIDSENEQ